MHGRSEPNVSKNRICMLVPEAGAIRMPLHGGEHWYDFTRVQGQPQKVMYPPFLEVAVRIYIEALFRRWSFRERIRHIGSIYQQVSNSSNTIEHPRAGLVNTVCIRLVKDEGFACAGGAIADAASLFTMIKGFNNVGPHYVEHGHIIVDKSRLSKHALCIVLVELQIFQILPFRPIRAFEEFTTGKPHHFCHNVVDTTILDWGKG
jgi:hypothetical protein